MKCPNCGYEMQEDHLYCEKCGMEIRIVPDFEPEIENSIIETLSTVAEEIEGKETVPEIPEEKPPEKKPEQKAEEEFFAEVQGKNWLFISLITFIVVVIVACFSGVFMYHRFSVTYQIDTAKKYAQSGKYQEAVAYLDKARELASENAEIVFLQSGYYYSMGEPGKSADILLELIEKEHLNYEDEEKAYERIISIYDEEERYEEISDLLLACQDEAIITLFQHYLALEPEFSCVSGSYDVVIPLKLSANTTGTIYYTLEDRKSVV